MAKKVLYKVEKDYFITDATPEKGKAEEAKKKLDLSHLRVRRGAHPGVGRDVQFGLAARARLLLTARR